jgi:hypothetical protein
MASERDVSSVEGEELEFMDCGEFGYWLPKADLEAASTDPRYRQLRERAAEWIQQKLRGENA